MSASPDLQTLLRLAPRYQVRDAQRAAGLCLSVSMEFALAVRQRTGCDVRLVRWRVEGDPHYVDHWAVECAQHQVLDLTRVQVDRSTRLVCDALDYPPHYTHRRSYPLALFSDVYVDSGGSTGPRLADRFLWVCGARVCRFDLLQAWRTRDPLAGADAVREFAKFVRQFALSGTLRWLERRAAHLMSRVHERPMLSARTQHGALEDGGFQATLPASVIDLADYKSRRELTRRAKKARKTI